MNTIPNYATLTPAYGRDYKSKKEVETDFKNGLDFRFQPSGVYTSIRDCTPGTSVMLRYKRLTMVHVYKVTGQECTPDNPKSITGLPK